MTDYASKGFTPLSQDDWEKVQSLRFGGRWPDSTLFFLRRLEADGVCPHQNMTEDGWHVSFGNLTPIINSAFRKAGLPYRVFKTAFGSDSYRIGIVTPFKRDRKPRKIQLTSNERQIVVYVLATARAVVKNPSRKNLAALERALRQPRLPTSYMFRS